METYRWSQLAGTGWTQHQLRAEVLAGGMIKVRHGVYAPDEPVTEAEQHLRLVRATVDQLRPGAVVSHFSAALLHGLPVPPRYLDRVWITRPGTRSTRAKGVVRLQRASLPGEDRARVHGLAVTSLARTAVDVACHLDFVAGVAVVDAALSLGTAAETLRETVAAARGATGVGRARQVVLVADGRAESVGESRSRALMHQYGVPLPDLQRDLYDEDGWMARVDFWWEKQRIAGEFDGKIKYTRELASDGDPSETLWREKKREDRIRRAGTAALG